MPKYIALPIVIILALVAFAGPSVVHGQGLVPCTDNCGFSDLIELANRVIKFLVFDIAAPLAAVSFAYAGVLLMTAQGNEAQHQKAKKIFVTVFIGFVIALSAWLIVKFILTLLVDPEALNDLNTFFAS